MHKSIILFIIALLPFVSWCQLSPEQEERVDELKTILDNETDDSLRIAALIEWDNMIYYFDSELDRELNQQVVDIAKNNVANKDLSAEKLLFFQNKLAAGLTILSILKKEAGELSDAIALQNESLDLYELTENANGQGNALHNLAVIYRMQDFFEEGMKYDKLSLAIRTKDDNQRGMASSYFSIGNTFANYHQNWDSASYYHHKAFYIFESLENFRWMSMCYQSFASVAQSQDDLELAEQYFDSSLIVIKNQGILSLEARAYAGLGRIHLNTNRWQAARKNLELSLQQAEQIGNIEIISNSAKLLASAYDSLGMDAKAYPVFKKYILLRDSLQNAENTRAILDQEYEYNYAKKAITDSLQLAKQLEIEEMQNEADLADEHLQQKLLWAGMGVFILLMGIVYVAYRRKAKDNDLISAQKAEVEIQKQILDIKNKEITDSITYAKRIQMAILPPLKMVKEYLPDSFIFYQPKDVVAGDFYWIEKADAIIYFAAADCTGHGVPGAMVSVVCNGALNRAVQEFGLREPGPILDKTREIVIEEFNKSDEEVKDGMDIALCSIKDNVLHYSGAHNPLWIVRKGELLETKADKQPIGQFDSATPFKTHKIELEKGDHIYLFSDGYVDQFGGDKGKKFKTKSFRELLLSIQSLSLSEQKKIIESSFDKWKGEFEQIDDVCVIGVRVS